MLSLQKFEEASEVVKQVTLETKLVYSDYFSAVSGNKVYLKPENMQFTGAYKLRGSYYTMSTLTQEERDRGLITASAGNHAQGGRFATARRPHEHDKFTLFNLKIEVVHRVIAIRVNLVDVLQR